MHALQIHPLFFQHLFCEKYGTKARCFFSYKASAVLQSFAGKNTLKFILQAFVLAIHVTDFPAANTDVSRWNIGMGANVFMQLRHIGLAETHDLAITLTFGVEIGSTLGCSQRQGGQAVLEGLFKAKELQRVQRQTRGEPQPAFVGADGIVELHPVAAIDTNMTFVVFPADPETDDAIRLRHPLENAGFDVLRVVIDVGNDTVGHFMNGLVKVRLVGVTPGKTTHEFIEVELAGEHAGFPLFDSEESEIVPRPPAYDGFSSRQSVQIKAQLCRNT